jgi:hypothetical protein
METLVSGWLFLNLERTRLVFVADELQVVETFEWDLLLHGDCLERFVATFSASPTTEGPLQGYRVDASRKSVKAFLSDCSEHHQMKLSQASTEAAD